MLVLQDGRAALRTVRLVVDTGLHALGWSGPWGTTYAANLRIKADAVGLTAQDYTSDKVAIDDAVKYAAEDADVTLRLWQTLKPRPRFYPNRACCPASLRMGNGW